MHTDARCVHIRPVLREQLERAQRVVVCIQRHVLQNRRVAARVIVIVAGDANDGVGVAASCEPRLEKAFQLFPLGWTTVSAAELGEDSADVRGDEGVARRLRRLC